MSRRGGAVGGGRSLKRKDIDDDDAWEPTAARGSSSSSSSRARSRQRGVSTRTAIDVTDASSDDDSVAALAVDDSDVDVDHRMAEIDSDSEDLDRRDSSVPSSRDFSTLQLKPDHERRPIWVCPNGRVFLDTSSPIYRQAYDFLIAISDLVCRPQFIHEYQITSYSLYAAASLGLQTEDILSGLTRLSKVLLAPELEAFVREKTERCGKVKLLLNKTRYFVESIYPEVLQELLKQPVIADARIDDKRKPIDPAAALPSSAPPSSSAPSSYSARQAEQARKRFEARALQERLDDAAQLRDPATGFLVSSSAENAAVILPGTNNAVADERAAMGLAEFERVINDDLPLSTKVLSFELAADKVEAVRRCCNEVSYPMLEEYDFAKDNSTPDLPIHLKPSAQIRDYQEKSLSKMFGNGRARSGIIVLPCGAGKVTRATAHTQSIPSHPTVGASRSPCALCALASPPDARGHHRRCDSEEECARAVHDGRGGGPVAASVPALVDTAQQVHLPVHQLSQGQVYHGRAGAHHHVQHGVVLGQTQRPGRRDHGAHHHAGVGPHHTRRGRRHQYRRSPLPSHSHSLSSSTFSLGARASPLRCRCSVHRGQVHVAPAKMFRKCVSVTHSRSKLGLTATLVREDNLVDDLFYLIGPKLYEANWLDLQTAGYIATVQCQSAPQRAQTPIGLLCSRCRREAALLCCSGALTAAVCPLCVAATRGQAWRSSAR